MLLSEPRISPATPSSIVSTQTKHARELRFGQAALITLSEGDLLDLRPLEGGSSLACLAIDQTGQSALGLLDLANGADGTNLCKMPQISGWVRAWGLDPRTLHAATLFGEEARPGDQLVLRARGTVHLWLAMPVLADRMSRAAGGTVLMSHRSLQRDMSSLPDPLGPVRDEFRIAAGTARAYELAKGEFVQILDVAGQQCSDFMALRASALDAGQERIIDSTVTRTLARGSHPRPGLFDTFYDQDMLPLLRLTQDTVGRHDTFALACTAIGYERRGYPGHVNCSDNISDAFSPFGIGRRTAWPAINFFFNSWIDPHSGGLMSDEAWSEPGDHVVLQAEDDLVAVSTACPDDIDPINGWNPTDIHVRIYKPEATLQYAVAYRPFEGSDKKMTTPSAFHARTEALTRSHAAARDTWLPTHYDATGTRQEYWAAREGAALQDMSSLRKFDISGPDAEALCQMCLTRDVSRLSDHRGHYTLMLNESAGVIDDGTLFRMGPGLFRWFCGSEESGRQLRGVAEAHGMKAWVRSQWSAMPNLALQGPKSRDILAEVFTPGRTMPTLTNLAFFGSSVGRVGGETGPAVQVTRTGYTGLLGYEIFCTEADAETVWDAIMAVGGVTPMGSHALEMLRMEAGLMAGGHEFSQLDDPFESGLGFAVPKKKMADFVGKGAAERNRVAPRKAIVGLKLAGADPCAHGDPVFIGRQQIGVVTSASYSPVLERAIAYARVVIEHSATDTAVQVGRLDNMIKRLDAEIVRFPFVDPERILVRS